LFIFLKWSFYLLLDYILTHFIVAYLDVLLSKSRNHLKDHVFFIKWCNFLITRDIENLIKMLIFNTKYFYRFFHVYLSKRLNFYLLALDVNTNTVLRYWTWSTIHLWAFLNDLLVFKGSVKQIFTVWMLNLASSTSPVRTRSTLHVGLYKVWLIIVWVTYAAYKWLIAKLEGMVLAG
jgi:hypothetical protein